jgi:hypothetical protein
MTMTSAKLRLAHSVKLTRQFVGNAVSNANGAREGAIALNLLLDASPKTSTKWDEIAAHADAVEYVARKVIHDVHIATDRLEQTYGMLFKEGKR